jgi:hypothetical protein
MLYKAMLVITLVVSLVLIGVPFGVAQAVDAAPMMVDAPCPHHAASESDAPKKSANKCCDDGCQCLGMNSCFGKTLLSPSLPIGHTPPLRTVNAAYAMASPFILFYLTTPPPRS